MERNITDIMFMIVGILAIIISLCMAVLVKDLEKTGVLGLNDINKYTVSDDTELFLQGVSIL